MVKLKIVLGLEPLIPPTEEEVEVLHQGNFIDWTRDVLINVPEEEILWFSGSFIQSLPHLGEEQKTGGMQMIVRLFLTGALALQDAALMTLICSRFWVIRQREMQLEKLKDKIQEEVKAGRVMVN